MTTLHPHWQTTDEDERPVHITDVKNPRVQTRTAVRARRAPAAFAGIAAVAMIGIVLFQGINGLMGQLNSDDATEIRLTQNGTEPRTVTVIPGKKIMWTNQSTIPQILASNTLPTSDNKPFMSTVIQPGSSFTYTLPATAGAATHEYISQTSAIISGQIIVDAPTAQATSSPAFPQIPAATNSAAAISSAPAQSSAALPIVPAQIFGDNDVAITGAIPQNPHTVGNANALPPVRQPQQQQTRSSSAAVMQHKPVSHPQSGMGLWAIAIAGVAAVWVVSRSAVRS
jgi:hypothetical protein